MFCKLPGKVSGFSFLVSGRSEESTCRKPETNNQKGKTNKKGLSGEQENRTGHRGNGGRRPAAAE
jgi:hypothetical protein